MFFPLREMWSAATEVGNGLDWLSMILQGGLLSMLAGSTILKKDISGRAACLSSLACFVGLWTYGALLGGSVVVVHWLGLLWIFAICAATRSSNGYVLVGLACVSVSLLAIPGILAVGLVRGSTQTPIREASAELNRIAPSVDSVVFGGSRAFILFEPELNDQTVDRCFTYLRDGAFPDNFIGRVLIPSERVLRENDWLAFNGRRIVTVELEAAQSVAVPNQGWEVVYRRRFIHMSNSIGEITIEIRRKTQ